MGPGGGGGLFGGGGGGSKGALLKLVPDALGVVGVGRVPF